MTARESTSTLGFCRHCHQPITQTGWHGKKVCQHLPHCPEGKKEEPGLV